MEAFIYKSKPKVAVKPVKLIVAGAVKSHDESCRCEHHQPYRTEALPPMQRGLYLISNSVRTIVICQDPGDGSGEVIIDLPSDILAAVKMGAGDSLSIELVNEAIVRRPIRDADTLP